MSNLIPRPSAQLESTIPDGFSRSEGKELQRLQNKELARGLVTATRVQAAGMVAAVGLQTTAMLSREAAFQADGDPAAAARLGHIVDQYATYVGSEVARFRH
ncbi:hypothetical protein C5E45_29330 [Nocardia nova]|uniref:Uncharacterized protein n=1 Tax=Nocardia nova TaxID=37330 RepID=A0A2S6AHR3_9NOCA|nr:hypothetical protein [Nocardia nova]PPJ23140.1 hypothetical protein C5E41_25460 [Nocardia nova]PPJ34750.1 hypothetical protein C5E45_29330 [Nocardia nova]